MVKHLYPDFVRIQAREEGLRVMLATYERNAIVNEMDAIAGMNRELARKLKEKLGDI